MTQMFRETFNCVRTTGGVVLNNPIIEANGRTFSLLEASVMDDKGEVSFEDLNKVLGKVASLGGLHGQPETLVAITKDEGAVYATIGYWGKSKDNSSKVANISGFSGGGSWPNLDVFLTNLTISHDSGTVAPILVVDPSIKLKPYGENKFDDSVDRIVNNNYAGLEKFVGQKYDGSLNLPELDKFKGFKFGNDEWSYVYGVTHRGKSLGVTGFLKALPNIGDKYECYDSEWEIQAITHDKFSDDFTGKDSKYAKKQFDQHLTFALKHLKYTPPLPPNQQRLKVVEDDKLFWTRVASLNNFDLHEIEPQYTDKDPLTPWYEAKHRETGKSVVLGTRWRVYSVDGKHISKGEPEQVLKYLSEIAKK